MKKVFVLTDTDSLFIALYSCRQKAQACMDKSTVCIDKTAVKGIEFMINEEYIDDSWPFTGNRDSMAKSDKEFVGKGEKVFVLMNSGGVFIGAYSCLEKAKDASRRLDNTYEDKPLIIEESVADVGVRVCGYQ